MNAPLHVTQLWHGDISLSRCVCSRTDRLCDRLLTWGAALFVALIHAATLRTNVTDVIDPAGDFYSQSPAFFLLFVLTVGLVPVEILQRTFLD